MTPTPLEVFHPSGSNTKLSSVPSIVERNKSYQPTENQRPTTQKKNKQTKNKQNESGRNVEKEDKKGDDDTIPMRNGTWAAVFFFFNSERII
jgi:hypothetical protein